MPKAKAKMETAEITGDEPSATTAPVTGDEQPTEVQIFDQAGTHVRTYSFAVHGKKFAELAESYLAGHPHCHK